MTLIEKQGDLLIGFKDKEVECITHCANAFCTMNSGVAWQIKTWYPAAYAADCLTVKGDQSKMGTCSVADILTQRIFNIYGQYTFGSDGAQYVEYDCLRSGLVYIRNYMIIYGFKSLGIPKLMGCARAGGKWSVVYDMINEVFAGTDLTVIIYEYNRQ